MADRPLRSAHAEALHLSGVAASRDGVTILRSIDLGLARGEVLAVLGRNGVGKTTLVEALFNLGPTVTGDVVVKGRRVNGWPTHRIARLGIALVPQGRGVFPTLRVDETLRMATLWPGRDAPRPWSQARVFDSFPHLAARRTSPSGALSGGERQLLAIARALLTGADILVLDEPSEGLAPLAIEEVIIGTVGRLTRDGMTILLAEQNVAMALRLATRAIVLSGGGVAFDGSPAALLADGDIQRDHLGV